MIRYKSAKYTIEHPLLLGGRLAGAGDGLLAAYSAYGLPLGEAFQLRDDVLGVFGDPAETGKPAGDDLREGKRTVLVALALERRHARAGGRRRRACSATPALDAAGVEALREVLVDTGALAAVERMVDGLVEQSLAALDAIDVAEPARAVLAGLVAAATDAGLLMAAPWPRRDLGPLDQVGQGGRDPARGLAAGPDPHRRRPDRPRRRRRRRPGRALGRDAAGRRRAQGHPAGARDRCQVAAPGVA